MQQRPRCVSQHIPIAEKTELLPQAMHRQCLCAGEIGDDSSGYDSSLEIPEPLGVAVNLTFAVPIASNLDPKPPTRMIWLGAVDAAKLKDAKENGTRVPGPHSSEFAPVPEPTIRTGVRAMSSAVLV